MKVAIIHDWLVSYGGAERVLEVLLQMFPDADVFTSVYDPKKLPALLKDRKVNTTYIQKFPFAKKLYRNYLFFMPKAFEEFDLRGYDLVISNSHACAKGVITEPKTCHICYCLTPVRYAWDMYHEYLEIENVSHLKRILISGPMSRLRAWDAVSSLRVDYFAGISEHVLNRVKKYYKRDGVVIYPPVDTEKFRVADKADDYYLAISRLVPQKRMDIIVEAFNKLGLPLKIVGTGRDLPELKKIAGKNVEFLGFKDDASMIELMGRCKALVFASYEDFGIVPLEAQACGRPAIVYGRGGARETVIDGVTGVFFDLQTADSVADAVKRSHAITFDPSRIREHAKGFDREVFKNNLTAFVNEKMAEHKNRMV